jgi:NADPH:quinone reductase-like Zn-dependent oxidoreductase
MRALIIDKPGKLDTLYVGELPKPIPEDKEVRVRVQAVSLNPVDYKLAQSGHPAWQYPFVLGLDVAGTIDAIGSGVNNWKVGDCVFYHGNLSRPGGFAEYTTTTAHVIAPIPENVSFIAAAAIPCAGLTAYQAIFRRLHVQAGQTLLVHGGAGGVGGYAVQLLTYAGANVIATASEHNFGYVRGLGASHMIDYRHENIRERVLEITKGRGVDAILDTVGLTSAGTDADMLAFGGGLVCIAGLPDFSHISFDRAISIHKIRLGGVYSFGDQTAQADLAHMAQEMIALLADGKIDPMVSQVITLEAIPAGLAELAGRHVRGKIVAEIG